MKRVLTKFQKMGFIETNVFAYTLFWKKTTSTLQIALLRLRGYGIDFSVELGKDVSFFQDTYQAICIRKNARIGSRVRIKAVLSGKVTIAEDAVIDDNTDIHSVYNVSIGKGTLIAARVYIIDSNHVSPLAQSRYLTTKAEGYIGAPITIGKYVWIGTNVVILQGVHIGDNAIIGAGAIVTKDVPANSVAVGNPARVIRKNR